MVARGLAVEYSHVFELLPDGATLLLRAGTGWREGFVGSAELSVEVDSPSCHALIAREPVIIEDLHSDARFGGATLLRDQGMVSGMSVVILSQGRPYGCLTSSPPGSGSLPGTIPTSSRPWPTCWLWPSTQAARAGAARRGPVAVRSDGDGRTVGRGRGP